MISIFKRQQKTEIKAATLNSEIQRIVEAMLPPQRFFNLDDPHTRRYKDFLSQYTNWVYICASRNAASIAAVPLRLYTAKTVRDSVKLLGRNKSVSRKRQLYLESKSHLTPVMANGEVEEIIVHPWLELLRKVNDFNNGFEMMELMVLYLELTGNAYWHILLGPSGVPLELWSLPSHLISFKHSISKGIEYYEFGVKKPLVRLETEEVAHFKYPNPLDPFYGLGPLEASQLPVTLNNRFNAFESSVLENGAVIPFFLGSDQNPNETLRARYRSDFDAVHKGWRKAGKFAMLWGGLKAMTVGSKPKDVNYETGLNLTKESICAAFGVPLSMVTTDNVNKANAEAGLEQYTRFTILPRLKRIEQVINQHIMPLYDENLFVAFDNPVPENQILELEAANTRLANHSQTINEYRESMGEDGVAWGDEPLVQGQWHNLSEIPEPSEPDDLDLDEDGESKRHFKFQTLRNGSPLASRVIQTQTQLWLNTTAIVAAGNISSVMITSENAVDAFIPWNQIKADGIEKLQVPLTDTLHSGAEKGVTRMLKQRISTSAWDVQNPHAIAWAEKYIERRIELVNINTKGAVREAVADALKKGKTQLELRAAIKQNIGLNTRQTKAMINLENRLIGQEIPEKEIQKILSLERQVKLKYRAEMIARTETSAAWAEGNTQSYREAGVQFKEFSAAGDACSICSPFNGKIYPIGSSEKTMPIHPNCRCDWLPVIEAPAINEPIEV